MSEVSQIADAVKAEVKLVEAMPVHVVANILEMLKRVAVTGDEAYAYVEAKMHLHKQHPNPPAPTGPGVPFGGTPAANGAKS